ncbi:MAG: dephospho-CoA kinase [Chloroflexi bacterium]|nr:dephospho-CoA kinase [Chloroflexota bacterium]
MSRWANKYVIGLTGNIAVGKSVVRQMLQHLGAYTIDADGLTHRAMAPGAPAYKPIVETFGQFILDADKNIDRNLLGAIVFSRPEALAKLEAIVHPIVGQAIGTLVSRASQPVVVIEAIKLLEGDLANAVDEIWVVDASPDTQLRRLVGQRKLSEADARQRIAAQGAQADKLAKATVIIRNDGNVEETWKQVQAAWVNVQKKLFAPSRPTDAPAAAQPRPAAAQPAAPARPQPTPDQTIPLAPTKVIVRRGMPTNAESIAQFISRTTGRNVSRMDVMMAFGQKSYLIAQDTSERILGLVGWQVENLITRVDEFYLIPGVTPTPVVQELLTAIEQASKDLQSEVGYIFLPPNTSPDTLQTFAKNGYERTSVEQIKIPAWREAVQELADGTRLILTKKLREDRVLKPI